MFTQVELVSTKEEIAVYWLNHDRNANVPVREGRGVRIKESDSYWRINRVCTTLRHLSDLPEKHRIGTIVELN